MQHPRPHQPHLLKAVVRYIHHHHHLKEIHHSHKTINKLVPFVMWTVAILAPLSTLPQIFDIYSTHSVSGLSLTTWFLFVLSPMIWLGYGLLHKDKFILVNNFLWMTMSSTVLIGILLYR